MNCNKCGKGKCKAYYLNAYWCKRCWKKECGKLARINKALKKAGLYKPDYRYPKQVYKYNKSTVTERVQNLRRRATPAEKEFNRKLKEVCPVRYQFQRGFVKGGYYAIVDFHIPSRKICIEIDGGYHNNPEQQKKDKKRDDWLTNVRGQRVIRITNERAFEIELHEITEMIRCQG